MRVTSCFFDIIVANYYNCDISWCSHYWSRDRPKIGDFPKVSICAFSTQFRSLSVFSSSFQVVWQWNI